MTLQKYAGMRLIDARRTAFTVGALMMIGVAFAGTVQNPYVAVALLSLGRVRAPDAVGHRHHDGVRSLQAQRGRHGGRHGGHVRQRRRAHLLAADGRARRAHRLHAVLHRRWPRSIVLGAVILWTVVREPQPARRPRRCQRSIRNPILPRLQSRSVDRARRRRLLHRDLDLRVVPGRADPSLARPRALAAGDAAARRAPASSTCAAIPIRAASGRRASPTPTDCSIWSTPT